MGVLRPLHSGLFPLSAEIRTMRRAEAVLLWLTLTLLGTPASGTQEYYGSTVGNRFCTAPPSGEDIAAIRMTKNAVRLLSVQVKYGETWSDVYGTKGGTSKEFVLNPGEYITQVSGSYMINILHVTVYTDEGRKAIFGNKVGTEFTVFPPKDGQVLKGFCGFYFLGGLKSIGFEWGDPQETSDSSEE
uniref:zymogen granule protein 16 homolog B n=1 Tax=Jaculus jaculus TaxID=51337 RepID=UPI001E1B5FC6|nr:zymogen granule protein 16 homolog B [Jaculus jaculus]